MDQEPPHHRNWYLVFVMFAAVLMAGTYNFAVDPNLPNGFIVGAVSVAFGLTLKEHWSRVQDAVVPKPA